MDAPDPQLGRGRHPFESACEVSHRGGQASAGKRGAAFLKKELGVGVPPAHAVGTARELIPSGSVDGPLQRAPEGLHRRPATMAGFTDGGSRTN